MKGFSWTQPACGVCWGNRHPDRVPVRVISATEERCCYCGRTTEGGIYVRVNPATVPAPTLRKDAA